MPWSSSQWRAIAASTMKKYGEKEGRKKLHEYKVEAGGHAVDHRKDKRRKKLKKWMKHHA